MILIKYMTEGLNAEGGIHNRFNEKLFAKDSAKTDGSSSSAFEGKVTFSSEDKTIRVIDKTINVISVSLKTRENKLVFWKKRKIEAFTIGVTSICLSTLSGGATLATLISLIGTFPLASASLLILFIGITVTAITLAVLSFHRRNQAGCQLKVWQDPLENFRQMRKNIKTDGYLYIYENKLKGTLAHLNEVEENFKNWANSFLKQYMTGSMDKNKIETFFNKKNPLEREIHGYIEPAQPLDHLITRFEVLKQEFQSLELDFDRKCEMIRTEKEKNLEKNELKHAEALKPSKSVLEQLLKNLDSQIDTELKNLPILDEKSSTAIKIREKYDTLRQSYNSFYEEWTKPINFNFDVLRKQIEIHVQKQIENAKDSSQILNYFSGQIQKLCKAYFENPEDITRESFDELNFRLDVSFPPPTINPFYREEARSMKPEIAEQFIELLARYQNPEKLTSN